MADANPEQFEVWVVRPSSIHSANAGALGKLAGKIPIVTSIGADHLASAMTQILLDGYSSRIIESDALLRFPAP